MPELPEVETTLRGIKPHLEQQTICSIVVRNSSLRWPIPPNINKLMQTQPIIELTRRGKYLLIKTLDGTLILHLGMSGSLRVVTAAIPAQKHDHVDINLSNHKILRFTDPRHFGALLWTSDDPLKHTLLKDLGPEPLSQAFTAKYLFDKAKSRKMPIKSFLMNSNIVVDVGNIYANEALFAAGIHPNLAAGKISLLRYQKLVEAIKMILRAAIKKGGTTLKDFSQSDGKPGYFSQKLKVYGRGGKPCVVCGKKLEEVRLGQRTTVYCEKCQK